MRKQLLALCLLISACGGSTPDVKESPGGLNLEVVTVDKGAEPRAPLRYMGQPGQDQRVLLRLSIASMVATTLAVAEAELPVVNVIASIGPSFRGAETGVLGYPVRFEFVRLEGDEGLDEPTRTALLAELKHLTESTAVFEIDDRGIARKADVSLSPNLSPRLLTLLSNIRTTLLSAALPEEEVGIGARWEVDRIVSVGAMKVPQKVSYSLLARDAEHLRVGVTVRQSAKPQKFSFGSDGSIDVEAYEVSAVGSTLIDLRNFAPFGEMHGLSQLRATFAKGTESQYISVSSDLMVQLAPLPEGAKVEGAAEAPAPAPAPQGTVGL